MPRFRADGRVGARFSTPPAGPGSPSASARGHEHQSMFTPGAKQHSAAVRGKAGPSRSKRFARHLRTHTAQRCSRLPLPRRWLRVDKACEPSGKSSVASSRVMVKLDLASATLSIGDIVETRTEVRGAARHHSALRARFGGTLIHRRAPCPLILRMSSARPLARTARPATPRRPDIHFRDRRHSDDGGACGCSPQRAQLPARCAACGL